MKKECDEKGQAWAQVEGMRGEGQPGRGTSGDAKKRYPLAKK
jgi:hypothetical protein